MSTDKDISKFVKDVKVNTNPKVDKAILAELVENLETTQAEGLIASKINIWRPIMKSRITKFAAAAAVVLVIIIGMHYLSIAPDGANMAWAQVQEALSNVKWMHFVKTDSSGDTEKWYCFESQTWIEKDNNGTIQYWRYRENRVDFYDSTNNDIYILDMDDTDPVVSATDPMEFIKKAIRADLLSKGAKMKRYTDQYNGIKVEVWEVERSEEKGKETMKLYIDSESYLPILSEIGYTLHNGDIKDQGVITFDYPETGPKDIYEAGAPLSAKVTKQDKGTSKNRDLSH